MSFLINAANLHGGGGVQVAVSIIYELFQNPSLPSDLMIWASGEVDADLRRLGIDVNRMSNYQVVNIYGFGMIFSKHIRNINCYNSIFTIFGPLYILWKMPRHICGFAQPWILYPKNEVSLSKSALDRLLVYSKYFIQTLFFKRTDILTVELDHVKDRLSLLSIKNRKDIVVIRNCVSSLYYQPDKWEFVALPSTPSLLRLGFVGRNYPHKNTRIFPKIIDFLKKKYDINARFFVTFNEHEWEECSQEFREVTHNVGMLSVSQCPKFYQGMDAVVFPSLLECFSATPLEAMVMEKPLFASDRPFNRDVCSSHAYYFDPLHPEDAAAKIAALFNAGGASFDVLQAARTHALGFSNARERALQCLALLIQSDIPK